jgi:16S rRNA (guanine966-N2)-methyltransferase
MRIISGEKRGMTILSPKTDGTRPVTDRIKESIFNVLQKYGPMEGKWVADLFCGTGSMGLEALSRGAGHVVFVEQDPRVIEILKKNIVKGRFEDRSKVVRANAFKVGAASLEERKFDLVFVDPPYAMSRDMGENSQLGGLLKVLCGQITDAAVVVVRTEERVELLENYGGLRVIDRRKWGSMGITLLRIGREVNSDA